MLAIAIAVLVSPVNSDCWAESPNRRAVAKITAVGPGGQGHAEAMVAAEKLRQIPSEQLPVVYDAMDTPNVIARNWLRGLAADIVRRSGNPDDEVLETYVLDRTRNGTGRTEALRQFRRQNPTAADEIIAASLNDPSLGIRELAVDAAIEDADSIDSEDAKVTRLTEVLSSARHPRQLQRLISSLRDLGSDVTTQSALAMLVQWQACAPFDNRGGIGFDTVYPPEQTFVQTGDVDLEATHDGKNGDVQWQQVEGDQESGFVDVAAVYDREKGAVAYLFTTVEVGFPRDAQVRLTTKNANKVWVNGTEVMANEVYHSGSVLDQYIADCELLEGTNRILIKLCQNEQTEGWAQEYQCQCRLTTPEGETIDPSL